MNLKKMKKKNDDTQNVFGVASQYRVFSRAYCNYVFPREIKDMIKDETDDDTPAPRAKKTRSGLPTGGRSRTRPDPDTPGSEPV